MIKRLGAAIWRLLFGPLQGWYLVMVTAVVFGAKLLLPALSNTGPAFIFGLLTGAGLLGVGMWVTALRQMAKLRREERYKPDSVTGFHILIHPIDQGYRTRFSGLDGTVPLPIIVQSLRTVALDLETNKPMAKHTVN